MLNLLTAEDLDRFWSKIDVRGEDECWPWVAKAKNAGYGVFKHKSGRNIVASRISCFLAYGTPPHASAKTLHSCDNPPCCNPGHLRWGTQKNNVDDAQERKRHINPPDTHANPEWNARRLAAMRKGEAVTNSKLTEPVVREIWRLHFLNKNASEIAATVGFSAGAVYEVCCGRRWRHLPDAPSVEDLKKGGVRRGFNQFS